MNTDAKAGHGTLEVPRLIGIKRDGGELTAGELAALITGYLDDEVTDAQIAALLMAGVIRGFTDAEAVALTEVLLASGERVDLSGLSGPTVDKHSTGGVGDTTTLITVPLLAAVGCQVAKLSGRGLGHTGGTLDKLEAIPGFSTRLSIEAFRSQVERLGLAVAAASEQLVPADRRLYALRDVTGTVADPSLIAASVMSKKLAGGAEHLVLDVKAGSGAFLTDVDDAVRLAERCVAIGRAHGRKTSALVTRMSQPLGPAVGNALEVAAAVEVLRGERAGALAELSVELAATGLADTGVGADEAVRRSRRALEDGSGLERLAALVTAQGGDPRVVDAPRQVLPSAPVVVEWRPAVDGVVTGFGARRLGELAGVLGAGRQHPDDVIDPAVGLEVEVGIGDAVGPDGPVAVRVHAGDDAAARRVIAELDAVVAVADGPADPGPLVHHRIGADVDDAGRSTSG